MEPSVKENFYLPLWIQSLVNTLKLRNKFSEANEISMGMSNDFETAIALGATHIRVGEAIMGPRVKV